MQIIPVIDLKDGYVVHAVRGNRCGYKPIRSRLCTSSSVQDIINAFLELYPFKIIYIADLNALTGTGHHIEQIGEVLTHYPETVFWVDAGFDQIADQHARLSNCVRVIGSESLQEYDLQRLNTFDRDFILSLDFSGNDLLGVAQLHDDPSIWPKTIIIMTLSRVGSNQGPDFEKLTEYRERYATKKLVAAGGIRNRQDLERLKKAGIHYAMIASALHTGSITGEDIIAIA